MGYQTRYSGGLSVATVFPGVPAHTANPISYASSAAVPAINDLVFCRVMAGYTAAATSIRVYIGASSGNICVAVYADDGTGLPGAMVATSGSVASPGTGPRSIALTSSALVTPGMWLAVGADNTTVTFGRGGGPNSSWAATGAKFQAAQSSAFPPPATAAAAAAWRSEYILIAE